MDLLLVFDEPRLAEFGVQEDNSFGKLLFVERTIVTFVQLHEDTTDSTIKIPLHPGREMER